MRGGEWQDDRHELQSRWLLRERGARPGRSTADDHDEFAPAHQASPWERPIKVQSLSLCGGQRARTRKKLAGLLCPDVRFGP